MDNPFASPDPQQAASGPGPLHQRLADPFARFGARFLDGLLLIACGLPGLALVALPAEREVRLLAVTVVVVLLSVLFTAYQWYLVARSGQTLGKRALGIRIVRDDGQPMDFWTGVVLREWVLGVVNTLLALVAGFSIVAPIDGLMVFTDQHRTLHDRIAKTRVVALGKSPDEDLLDGLEAL